MVYIWYSLIFVVLICLSKLLRLVSRHFLEKWLSLDYGDEEQARYLCQIGEVSLPFLTHGLDNLFSAVTR